ncbi:uncharacterized protein [Prorops nasuta]|uniref:uncharacterized protein n=1 Tax=Prorops nasuta TaxID=863751 RepID=UPI0034CE9E52
MALGKPDWLNKDFVERVLRKSEADETIRVIDIFVKPATSKGDNYTSDMLRVTVEFSHQQGKKMIKDKISIIIKIAPMEEGIRKDLISKSGIFENEMHMMTSTLVKMNELLAPTGIRLSSRALYIQREEPVLLVLEDLAPLGYCMAERTSGLDLTHCLLAIKNLARFHASTVAVLEKEPKLKEVYNIGIYSEKHPPEMRKYFIENVKLLSTEISKWPELDPKYSRKLIKMADNIYLKGCENVTVSEDEFNVINHGDFWVNNMLFRYSDDGKPIDHIFVDFQLPFYGSPAIDLQYFFNTSPSPKVYSDHKEHLMQEYHKTLISTMKQLNCTTTPPTLDEIHKQMRKRATLGMIATFTILPIVLVDKSEAKDLGEMMENGTYTNPGLQSKAFRTVFTKRISGFDQLGLLD